MKLYFSPGACSLSPHIVLHEAGLAFEPVMASTKTHKLADGGDYYEINPLGYVPMLELDDGTRLREGPAIVQYIADLAPAKNLAPAAGTLQRYRLQEWLNFIGTEMHKGYSPMFNPNMPEEAKTIAQTRLKSRYQWLDGQLKDKEYLMGEHFSVADAYLFTVTNWAKPTNLDLAPYPNVQAWHARVGERPAVQAALKAEADAKAAAA
ncbi:Glutathione S-transferase GST-6.0 [Burkholderiales bacterium 8X]|nr:Glutathione S-transferase GST-6.0 [Burkholderiales bacterium 8X]